ncbi:TetR/AcrR family transcriptional regulator [Cypionkella sinensis]|uniref:TetR/AcrR family transcriptional regulator n=1 Tax=Cypionkella sinensis TaxID=1756043 RepID=A0ABV7J338_9RHOB
MKTSYHHGELRQALISAARILMNERHGNDFSLSDACRRAGVSTAAPYRHFADKTEIINEVVAQGFTDMTNRFREAIKPLAPGDPRRIIAVGQVYLGFAMAEPALFRMMFSQSSNLSEEDIVTTHGRACFAYVLQEVIDHCAFHGVEGNAMMIAVQLWTLVHGAASLTIDGDYAKVAPEVDTQEMMAKGAERLLFHLPKRGGATV